MPKISIHTLLLQCVCSITLSLGTRAFSQTIPSAPRPSGNIIWSTKPASEWPEGYPIGNGRLGGMVLGGIQQERIALNHDLLWRQYWTYQNRNTAADIKKIRKFNVAGEWDKGDELAMQKIPFTGNAIYINPYVPAGDLYINFHHSTQAPTNYRRLLDMENGITSTAYSIGDTHFNRKSFCSWKYGVLVTELTTNRAGTLTGEVSLSRLLDPDCTVTGYSTPDKVILKGRFDEGREFAIVAKLLQRGGRQGIAKKFLKQDSANMPPKEYGLKYVFSKNEQFGKDDGASVFFDSADEVLILVSITIDEEVEKGADLVKKCVEKLDKIGETYPALKKEHSERASKIYNRVQLHLGGSERDSVSTDSLLRRSVLENSAPPALMEKMFNLSRYLAISSGSPQAVGQPAKAPINLQGIWNQDRRPAWDCDYHLDLNLEMCYWPLNMLNLGDLMLPLMDWAERQIPGGRVAARDMYGSNGIAFGVVADYRNIGNVDNFAFFWTGGAAWISQILWQQFEYTGDMKFLKERMYPFLEEVGEFYEDFLVPDAKGMLVPALSASPEMSIAGRKKVSFSSSASSMDLELIHAVFENLILSGSLLKTDATKIFKWQQLLSKVPLPRIGKDGSLSEWLEDHVMADSGHRHRSPLVALVPGTRISMEDTRTYADAAYKTLMNRNQHGRKSTQSFTFIWDTQMLARLYRGQEAYDEFKRVFPSHVMENLLMTCNDWSGTHGGLAWFKGVKLFQVEANIGAGASIIEMIFQDGQGLLKFLPALPAELANGSVHGLRARGGFEAGVEWEKGRLMKATIESLNGQICRFKNIGYKNFSITSEGKSVVYEVNKDVVSFRTEKNKKYVLMFR